MLQFLYMLQEFIRYNYIMKVKYTFVTLIHDLCNELKCINDGKCSLNTLNPIQCYKVVRL